MKRIAMLALGVTVSSMTVPGSMPITINMPDATGIYLIPMTEMCTSTPTVAVTTVTVTVPAPPVLSTGPVTMKAATSADCYQIPYMNPNGTIGPTKYVTCPK